MIGLTIVRSADSQKTWFDTLTPLAGPAVALIAIWAVHSLTKSRDREKAVFDLYKTVREAVDGIKPIIVKAWEEDNPHARRTAIAETMWRLQQIGALAERIRRQSRRWALRGIMTPPSLRTLPRSMPATDVFWHATEVGWSRSSRAWHATAPWLRHISRPWTWRIEIRLTGFMAELRDAITEDPFNDPDRTADRTKGEFVELAIGGFLQSMDESLFVWMDDGRTT